MEIFEEYESFYNMVKFNKNDAWLFPSYLRGENLACDGPNKNIPFLLGEIGVPNSFINNNFFFRPTDEKHCVVRHLLTLIFEKLSYFCYYAFTSRHKI